ncbi:hypothetical protein NYP20_16275 [Pseudomonas sp. N3-W]|uniref:Lipoprotein n=1 Tax=Pseudomonas fungipugnans TaxID=3024217 RepID=A0ABT6QGS9_9PSED|nr:MULTISPECIES: hypothetical protein [unclassified Pseudomonas]MDI2589995.1 hypothetical protein [Pseudomonas sp. 681]UWF46906.1 hypothetical protein NYP20_16275 [Pseudomonas sp. N3-W]
MIKKITTILFLSVFLVACAGKPTQKELDNADYGQPVEQSIAEDLTKSFFAQYLKDPYSAQYSFGGIYKGYNVGSVFENRKITAGYLLDVSINAKNSYGGYVGTKTYKFIFHNGRMVRGYEILKASGAPITIY